MYFYFYFLLISSPILWGTNSSCFFPYFYHGGREEKLFLKFLNFSSVVAFPCQQALTLNRRIEINSDHNCTSTTVIRNYCRDSPFGQLYKIDFLQSQRYQMSLPQSKIQTPFSICGQVEGIIFHAIHATSLTSAAFLVQEIQNCIKISPYLYNADHFVMRLFLSFIFFCVRNEREPITLRPSYSETDWSFQLLNRWSKLPYSNTIQFQSL